MRECSGSALSYTSQPGTLTLLDMPDLMDEDEGPGEAEESPKDPAPESGPLLEVRDIACWVNDPVPLAHSFLVCRSMRFAKW